MQASRHGPVLLVLAVIALALLVSARVSAAVQRDIPAPDGPTLARNVRNMVPEAAEVRGTLSIRRGPGKRLKIPVRFETIIGENHWRSVYETSTNAVPQERLTVIHAFDSTNQYRWHRPDPSSATNTATVGPSDLMRPFAGSDFWLTDLGLDFLHWPEQRLLKEKNGMRKSRYCRVLESINPFPAPGGYARVVSWIDHEFGGVILAEAYDAKRILMKSFEIDGVTEVEDRWRLKAMEILDHRTDSLTRLEFDYTIKP
jgi:hypothetical protein